MRGNRSVEIMNNQERFIRMKRWGALKAVEIWVDTQTGVNYVFVRAGYAGGLSPLLDANGKPIVSEEYIRKN